MTPPLSPNSGYSHSPVSPRSISPLSPAPNTALTTGQFSKIPPPSPRAMALGQLHSPSPNQKHVPPPADIHIDLCPHPPISDAGLAYADDSEDDTPMVIPLDIRKSSALSSTNKVKFPIVEGGQPSPPVQKPPSRKASASPATSRELRMPVRAARAVVPRLPPIQRCDLVEH
ncbi:hypothetical protein K503DRAFT_803612 [Rhizopogon vinicolor AM-OR11-026]|uniref:Uncharacterized protein n=1 Tax=Rhizopogon vinicolor AM-OR11-026 TaxID=1314800 RepID=A0A1B7MP79_9AGAM|nr:hypothetical protein K503DRAFT_803612 [Rhizopogon vinicolor AM-OR11-026]